MNTSSNQSAKKSGIWLKLAMLLIIIILAVILWRQFAQDNEPQVHAISREGVVSRIQQLNRLETVSYNVDTVITSEQEGSWQNLWQDKQKGLFIARGRVVAGVDLSGLSKEMVQVSEPTPEQMEAAKQRAIENGNEDVPVDVMPNIMITLPPAEVFSVYLDDVQVYDWQAGGIFGMVEAQPEILNQAQIKAKQEVLERACQDGVMQQAEANAKTEMTQLFAMTGAEVTVNTQGAGACQASD